MAQCCHIVINANDISTVFIKLSIYCIFILLTIRLNIFIKKNVHFYNNVNVNVKLQCIGYCRTITCI